MSHTCTTVEIAWRAELSIPWCVMKSEKRPVPLAPYMMWRWSKQANGDSPRLVLRRRVKLCWMSMHGSLPDGNHPCIAQRVRAQKRTREVTSSQ